MKRTGTTFSLLLSVIAASSCGIFDHGILWSGGPYELHWIDRSDNTTVSYKLEGGGSIGRIESSVYAIGWDGRYLVVKQHPGGDKLKTNFYFIDSQSDSANSEPAAVVVGPLTEEEFMIEADESHLPGFSKTIAELE